MKNSIAISVHNVSKKYRLYGSPRERFWEALHPFNKIYHHEFWALKDISFDVSKGMTLGIIGQNGSGKSTMLQIICSVLQPTSGTVTVDGRISALLELGAGFNPEFTGRQNVLMNGRVVGFSKAEMEERLPLIKAFADIGEFFDQPVKIYSSGMFVRLAFAAAINVDPDILIVDEALAVGDAKFQHKCYQTFIEFKKANKTIVFVTHDTNVVVNNCDYAVLLEHGEIIEQGVPKDIVYYYHDLLFTGQIRKYRSSPVSIEEDYRDFNIVHYGKNYFAFALSLGLIDLASENLDAIAERVEKNKFVKAGSLVECKRLIDIIAESRSETTSGPQAFYGAKLYNNKVTEFLQNRSHNDDCFSRRSYNKNEHISGDGDVNIIDYLIVTGEKYDAFQIESGESVDLYMKVLFRKDVRFPLYGFCVNTQKGILVYGANTYMSNVPVRSMNKGETTIIKFSFNLQVNSGDYFINLGVCENESQQLLKRRCGIAHIVVKKGNECFFTGISDLKSRIEQLDEVDCLNSNNKSGSACNSEIPT